MNIKFGKLTRQSGKFTDNLESFHTIWKHFQTICKAYRRTGNFPDDLESFQTKVSGQSENILNILITFQTILKVLTQSEKLTDNLDTL